MLSVVTSFGRIGIEGYPMRVEVDVRDGLPQMDVVGLPDAAVRESRERVRTAMKNSGYQFPVAVIKRRGLGTICPLHWASWLPPVRRRRRSLAG